MVIWLFVDFICLYLLNHIRNIRKHKFFFFCVLMCLMWFKFTCFYSYRFLVARASLCRNDTVHLLFIVYHSSYSALSTFHSELGTFSLSTRYLILATPINHKELLHTTHRHIVIQLFLHCLTYNE